MICQFEQSEKPIRLAIAGLLSTCSASLIYNPSPNSLMAFSPNTLRLLSGEIFVLLATGPVTCPGTEESQWGESVAKTRRSPPKYSTAHSNNPSSKGSQPTKTLSLKMSVGLRFCQGTRWGSFSKCSSMRDSHQGICEAPVSKQMIFKSGCFSMTPPHRYTIKHTMLSRVRPTMWEKKKLSAKRSWPMEPVLV